MTNDFLGELLRLPYSLWVILTTAAHNAASRGVLRTSATYEKTGSDMLTSGFIVEADRNFAVIQHGKGIAYTLDNRRTGESLYFQGDDATEFEKDLELCTQTFMPRAALQRLWNLYS